MELAEGPQISGEVMFLILAVMLAMVLAGIGMVVLGCIWAYRAGRGSPTSRVAFGVVAVVEALLFVMSLTENSVGYSLLVLLAVQGAFFLAGRRRGPAPPLPGDERRDGGGA